MGDKEGFEKSGSPACSSDSSELRSSTLEPVEPAPGDSGPGRARRAASQCSEPLLVGGNVQLQRSSRVSWQGREGQRGSEKLCDGRMASSFEAALFLLLHRYHPSYLQRLEPRPWSRPRLWLWPGIFSAPQCLSPGKLLTNFVHKLHDPFVVFEHPSIPLSSS